MIRDKFAISSSRTYLPVWPLTQEDCRKISIACEKICGRGRFDQGKKPLEKEKKGKEHGK